MTALTTDGILELLQETAERVIRPRWRDLSTHEVHEKAPGDLVTVADHESEDIINAALRKAFPDALVFGEETAAGQPDLVDLVPGAEHVFVVDPVDGTRNFVHGRPDYAVMVGELRGGQITRGWIWQPEYADAWVAERGAGVTLNGEQLRPPTRSAGPVRGETTHRRLLGNAPEGVDPEIGWTTYSCGIDYPRLCRGDLDFLIYRHMKAWDHVPGTLMVRELGGVAKTVDDVDYQAEPTAPPLVAAVDAEAWRLGRACLRD